MSTFSKTVHSLASFKNSDSQDKNLAQEIDQMILGNPRLRIDFVEAGIVPVALRKFDDCRDAESRVTYAKLLRTMTIQKGFQDDSQIQYGLGRARRELRELGVLFVIFRVLRLEERHGPDIWLSLSDTMSAVMDRVSLPFNELAVPWLVLQLEQCWAPWQVYCCASMLRSCLGIRGKVSHAEAGLEHAFLAGCVPVLISKLANCCGQDGNQPIASMLKALTRVSHISCTALNLNIIPAVLSNVASPEPSPSSFIDPDGEWCDELDYHRNLVGVLRNLVCIQHPFAAAAFQSPQMQGSFVLLRENIIPLLVDRLWCKKSSKLLLTIATSIEKEGSLINGHFRADCEQFFLDYSRALMTKLAEMTSSIVLHHRDTVQRVDARETIEFAPKRAVINELAVARAIAALSALPGGKKAILECIGGITVIVKFLNFVLRKEVILDPPILLLHPCIGIGLHAVSKHGIHLLHSVLSTLLNLVKVRRGTKGAVAAGAFHAITPVLFTVKVLDELDHGEEESRQNLQISRLHAIAAEILARISSITKGQRQAVTVVPTILNALCVHSTQIPSSLVCLIDALGNVASTRDGLSYLAFCNAAPVLQSVGELLMMVQSPPEEIQTQTESAGKLQVLHTLVKSHQARLSDFSDLVFSSCACAASKCLVWPEGSGVSEFQAPLMPKTGSFAEAVTKQGLVLPWLCQLTTSAVSCSAFLGMLIQRMAIDMGISFSKTILQYSVSKKFDRRFNIRMIRKTIGTTFANGCISIRTWLDNHALTCLAARMIQEVLEGQEKSHLAKEQQLGHWPIHMVAAHLQAKLPKSCDASVIARSAVSIFSPPLALLEIGEGNSQSVVLCQHSGIVPAALARHSSDRIVHFNEKPFLHGKHSSALSDSMDVPKDALTHQFYTLARELCGVSTKERVARIADDVMHVIRDFPALHAAPQKFWRENGEEELRICIKGLVTTNYKSRSYQTPIKMLLSDRYPQDPPDFFVDLEVARNMIVTRNHPCVDSDGKVRRPP
jgi:hypothetical protein